MFTFINQCLNSFFGLHYIVVFSHQSPAQHLTSTGFFVQSLGYHFLWTRVLSNVLITLHPPLEAYLFEFRVTNTWLKYVMYGCVSIGYLSICIFYRNRKRWIIDQPKRWSRMLNLFKFFGSKATFTNKSIRQFSQDFAVQLKQSNNHLQIQSLLIRSCFLLSFNMNQLVFLIGIMILNESLQTMSTFYAAPIQILWFFHYKYSFNFSALFIMDTFLLYTCNLVFYWIRLKSLNRHLKCILETCCLSQPFKFSPNSRKQLFNIQKEMCRQSTTVTDFQYKFVQLVDEIQYAKQIVGPMMSLVYFCGVICSLAYFFLSFFLSEFSIPFNFLIVLNVLVESTYLLPACFLGQMVIKQVNRILFKIQVSVSNLKLISNCFLGLKKGSKLVKTMHLINTRLQLKLLTRFSRISLVMIGNQSELFGFPLLFAADFSTLSFLQVHKKLKKLLVNLN